MKCVDVGFVDEMEVFVVWVGSEFGGVDVVINNVGIGMVGGIFDMSVWYWEWILYVNLWGVIYGLWLFV